MNIKHLLLGVAVLACCGSAVAQTSYPEKDSTGTVVYYRIRSAYPNYSNLYITDNTTKAISSAGYYYTVSPYDVTATGQQWQVVAATAGSDTTYYFRNRRTRRYIGATGAWRGNYYAQSYAGTKVGLTPISVTDIGAGQITLSFEEDGEKRYIFAADSAGIAPPYSRYVVRNTPWAWKVCNIVGIPVSVKQMLRDNNVTVSVVDRHIRVEGADAYSVYTDDGVEVPADAALQPGVYLVNAKGIAYKVIVK